MQIVNRSAQALQLHPFRHLQNPSLINRPPLHLRRPVSPDLEQNITFTTTLPKTESDPTPSKKPIFIRLAILKRHQEPRLANRSREIHRRVARLREHGEQLVLLPSWQDAVVRDSIAIPVGPGIPDSAEIRTYFLDLGLDHFPCHAKTAAGRRAEEIPKA